MSRDGGFLISLLTELRGLPKETGWVEFKQNNAQPEMIGEYISALSNSAALEGKKDAYLVWGIEDETHNIIGTTFRPSAVKKGNEELENWLLRLLSPRIMFRFFEIETDDGLVVILQIERASNKPVQFQGQEYIRIGSYKKNIKEYPEKERELWRIFDQKPYEDLISLQNIPEDEVLNYLDYSKYFELQDIPLPENRYLILERLVEDKMIMKNSAAGYDITNLGAILLAKELSKFPNLKRKSVRVIIYKGKNRIETVREQEGGKGYASGFEGLIGFIDNLLPRNEVIEKALRKEVPMYPELSVRELVANAIIHQDLTLRGTGPMIEIFTDRMEITNPGIPLVNTERFLDSPPRSRNESLASFMRRVGVCEERGSGIDKVVSQTEFYQLPAPVIEVTEEHTRVTLYSYKPFNEMEKEEKIQACYFHACLKYVSKDYMTNASLRQRFGLDDKNSSTASRIIRDAVDANKVKPLDPNTAPRYMKYVPYWA
ncbi:Predicted transcriptional regulator, contains HTH domain [Desulfonispora thiosulfatigenes DSM 11270]|uniref:Predicted transcriptional regulator, contains HTH domain n=1 Tax=Desulfonispora thiosulfatigenes DSM 11270 TaxID=656914 RepID=A0A1W1V6Z4_DESTI|nr:ATP-binding protein [Desulfonispora thiosulfatigenes]SMB89093.1 Predicted transcriptional regulator, contains HTH domain [Desulfonispora thiosulfatigenes DSM 11270]